MGDQELQIRLLRLRYAEMAEALKVVGEGVPQRLGQDLQWAAHAELSQALVAADSVGKFRSGARPT